MNHDVQFLSRAWQELVDPFGPVPKVSEAVFSHLIAAYSSADRHYHDLSHIRNVLDTISRLQDQASDLGAVRFAAWFHDVIYDSKAHDNEERSADAASVALKELQVPDSTNSRVRELILLTKTHKAADTDGDAHVLLDADLAVLGSSPEEYDRYSSAIRREYAWVPEEQYRIGRKKVLESFLQRERIYRTESMFAGLEVTARSNLGREMDCLNRHSKI